MKNKNQRELNFNLDLNQMSETLNQGQMPEELKFFYGDENDDFLTKLKILELNGDMQKFGEFLISDCFVKMLRENKLTIHIKTGNIYYETFNINSNLFFVISSEKVSLKCLYELFIETNLTD